MRVKRSTVAGVVPVLGPSNDHTDGTWVSATNNEIYTGEFFYNVPDKKLWVGGDTTPIELTGGGYGDAVESALIEGGYCIELGGSLPNSIASNAQSCAIVGGVDNDIVLSSKMSSIIGGYTNECGATAASILGGNSNIITAGATGSNILGGEFNTVNSAALNSVILGGSGISATEPDTAYAPNLNIQAGKGISFGTGNVMVMKELDIGDWDMDADISKNVAHGLSATEWKTVRIVSVTIRNDFDTLYADFGSFLDSTSFGNTIQTNATNISLTRGGGGYFDNTTYDATAYNRGTITFWYTPD